MIKMIIKISRKKGNRNYFSSTEITHINNTLLIRVFETPEKYLSHGEEKSVTRKVSTYSVKSYSTVFSCSLHAMHNRVYHAQKQGIMLKP